MKRKFIESKISIILFTHTDLLTSSGEDDAIVEDSRWETGGFSPNIFQGN